MYAEILSSVEALEVGPVLDELSFGGSGCLDSASFIAVAVWSTTVSLRAVVELLLLLESQ